MMRIAKYILLLLLPPVVATQAATYFVSASLGSDGNDGRSESTPWKSIAKVNALRLEPGDSLLFRRGDIWKDAVLLYFTESGTAALPIHIGAYGEGAKPILTDITPVDGSMDTLRWGARGGNVWALRCAETPNRLWLDGSEVLCAAIAQDVGTTNTEGAFESWYYSAADSTLLLHSVGNPAAIWRAIEGNRPAGVLALYRSEYIIIEGLDFRGGRWSTVYGGACAHITFRDCAVGYGQTGVRLTSADASAAAHHVVFEHCLFDSGMNFRYGLSSQGLSGPRDASKRGSEDGIIFDQAVNNCIVRRSRFTGWGHVSINCYAPDSTFDGVYANSFHDNSLDGSHISYTRPFATAGAEGKCHHNEFRNNIATDHSVRSQIAGNDNWVHHNIIDGMTTSPAKYFGAEGSGQGILLSVYGQTLVCHGNRIEHNLFVRISETAVALWSHQFPNKVHGNAVRNNIMFNAGFNPANRADTGIAILLRDTLEVYGNVIEHNCLYNPRAPAAPVVRYYDRRLDIPGINGTDGRHGNSIAANIQADPLFVDADRRDYNLRASSPCIDAARVLPDITVDLDGNAIPLGGGPDIGPYEYRVPVGVEEETPIALRSTVFPNPCTGTSTLALHEPVRNGTLTIYNVRGDIVLAYDGVEGSTFTLRTAPLPRGIYYYRMTENAALSAAGVLVRE